MGVAFEGSSLETALVAILNSTAEEGGKLKGPTASALEKVTVMDFTQPWMRVASVLDAAILEQQREEAATAPGIPRAATMPSLLELELVAETAAAPAAAHGDSALAEAVALLRYFRGEVQARGQARGQPLMFDVIVLAKGQSETGLIESYLSTIATLAGVPVRLMELPLVPLKPELQESLFGCKTWLGQRGGSSSSSDSSSDSSSGSQDNTRHRRLDGSVHGTSGSTCTGGQLTGLIAPSEFVQEQLGRGRPLLLPTHVINPGVDIDKFRLRRNLSRSSFVDDAFANDEGVGKMAYMDGVRINVRTVVRRIIFVGRLDPEKGLGLLLDAIAILRRRFKRPFQRSIQPAMRQRAKQQQQQQQHQQQQSVTAASTMSGTAASMATAASRFPWSCYEYTNEEKAWIASGKHDKLVCERTRTVVSQGVVLDTEYEYKYTGGRIDFDGCEKCWCCRRRSEKPRREKPRMKLTVGAGAGAGAGARYRADDA
jgi:hypothetical protein